jgi:ribosomal protein S18 acetylase RimI-like enzyme
MELRRATLADASLIGRLHADSWRLAYRGALSDEYLDKDVDHDQLLLWRERLESPPPNQNAFLLVEDTRLVGFACVYVNHHPEFGSYLNNLHVAGDRLRHGYGTRLMAAVRECCMRLSPTSALYLYVLESNERARAFYSRLGAVFHGTELWQPPGGGETIINKLSWPTPGEVRFDA